MSGTKPQIQESQSTTQEDKCQNKNKNVYLGIFKLQKIKDKEKILEGDKEGKNHLIDKQIQ